MRENPSELCRYLWLWRKETIKNNVSIFRAGRVSRSFLIFQQPNILISRRSAQIANPRKLRQVHLASLERWVVSQKRRRNVVSGYVRSAYLCAFGSGVCHAAAHSIADNTQFQLRENAADLNKGVCHRVDLSAGAVHADTADDGQPQALFFDCFDDFAQLL